MANGIHKKFGYEPSEILRGTNVDAISFVGAGGSLKEDHMKLFGRVDTLVERQIVSRDQQKLIKLEVSGVPDKDRANEELKAIESCPAVKDVFKKVQPRVRNPLYD